MFLSKEHKLHTTRSWKFLGLQRNGRNISWQKRRFGENTIISNIDIGKLYNDFTIQVGGTKVRVGGMAKGSGMIHPNMATMLGGGDVP
ncbi:hypothetical protein JHK87_055266 [Glycine soja]|nr:hypothetical protein JHK87_055266 [Glycine soja]